MNSLVSHSITLTVSQLVGFPISFFPSDLQERIESISKQNTKSQQTAIAGTEMVPSSQQSETQVAERIQKAGMPSVSNASSLTKSDFWDLLIKLDASFGSPLTSHVSTPRKISTGPGGKQVSNNIFCICSVHCFLF